MTGGFPGGTCFAIALTRDGARTARRLAETLPRTRAFAPARFSGEGVEGFGEPVAHLIARLWPSAGAFLLVMAAGIAVRAIAPLLEDKARDPAVVVLDAAGRFAVPILSGHLGGANEVARAAAGVLGGVPVITTATDAAGRPAAEVWAAGRGLRIGDRSGVVRVNAAWANGDPVGLYVDPALAAGALAADLEGHLALATADEEEARRFQGVLMAVTHRRWAEAAPALVLRPPCLALGVGCRKGAGPDAVGSGVKAALAEAGLAVDAVAVVASVEAKRGEAALLALARDLGVVYETFPSERLSRVPVPTPSDRVRRAVGTASVAEASALAASEGGELIVSKVKGPDWTLAVALRPAASWMGSA